MCPNFVIPQESRLTIARHDRQCVSSNGSGRFSVGRGSSNLHVRSLFKDVANVRTLKVGHKGRQLQFHGDRNSSAHTQLMSSCGDKALVATTSGRILSGVGHCLLTLSGSRALGANLGRAASATIS